MPSERSLIQVNPGHRYCLSCNTAVARENLIEVARLERLATHDPTAEARRAETKRRQKVAERAWKPTDLPAWLDERTYLSEIRPRLTRITVSAISSALSISKPYATDIRSGKRVPHPRHWSVLAKLAWRFRVSSPSFRTLLFYSLAKHLKRSFYWLSEAWQLSRGVTV